MIHETISIVIKLIFHSMMAMSNRLPRMYIPQLFPFASASSHVSDFKCRNKALTAKLLKHGYRYHKFRKALSKFYRRDSGLVEEHDDSLKKLLKQGISEPEFYSDIVYRFRFFRNNSESLLTLIKE